MRLRLSIDDLEGLNGSQRENLKKIWTPQRYDIAVSRVCVNVETDEYRWIEFAVGDIVIRGSSVILKDLRLTDGYVKIGDSETVDAEDFVLEEPTSFDKADTLPLLTLGQMITMLYMLDKSKYHFYLLTGNSDYACEIGDFNSSLKSSILSKPEKGDELVDVLWNTFKAIL